MFQNTTCFYLAFFIIKDNSLGKGQMGVHPALAVPAITITAQQPACL
jgi:hypothetical protein